ncbi:MAG: ester cyclase [Acidobacteriaceae bacterium]
MSEENKNLVRRWFEEVWNKRRISAVAEMYHPSGHAHGFPDPDSVLTGPEQFAAACKNFHETFSDIHITLDELVAEGDKVAVRWTATMTHTGEGLGFPATFRKVNLPGSSFVIFEKGMIIDGWNQMDFTRIQKQLKESASDEVPVTT